MDIVTPNFDTWTADTVAWLERRLLDLGWTCRDLDMALGFVKSRGAYTIMVLRHGRIPSRRYRHALRRWNNNEPRPADLLDRIQAVAVPWLRAREGQPIPNRIYTRRQVRLIRRQHHASE